MAILGRHLTACIAACLWLVALPAHAGPGDWDAALRRANLHIDLYESALASKNPALIREAGLRVQRDPIAVQVVNKQRSGLIGELNQTLGAVRQQARQTIIAETARRYGVKPEQVTFFEAKNTSTTPKVGQDWDVTVIVDNKVVKAVDSKDIVHRAYYEAATGKPAPNAHTAHRYADLQAVEVTDSLSADSYGGGAKEGHSLIDGPKDTPNMRDPHQMALVIEHKSMTAGQRAATLESDAAMLDSLARKMDAQGKTADARKFRNDAHELRLDAQGQRYEQGRQFTKQYFNQIEPRTTGGARIDPQVVSGYAILKDMEELKFGPDEARAKILSQTGISTEDVIHKGAGQVAAVQVLSPAPKPLPQPDVLPQNVRDQLDLDKLKREKLELDRLAKEKLELDRLAKEKIELDRQAKAKAAAQAGASAHGAAGGQAPPKEAPASPGVKEAPAKPGVKETLEKKLNVILNVSQFIECLQGKKPAQSSASRAAECLREQAFGFAVSEAFTGAVAGGTQLFEFYLPAYYAKFAPIGGFLGQVAIHGYTGKVAGEQLAELAWESKLWWDALNVEERAQSGSDAFERNNVQHFVRRLLIEEKLVQDSSAAIIADWRALGAALANAQEVQRKGLQQIPTDFERRLNDYWTRSWAAVLSCEAERDAGAQGNAQQAQRDSTIDHSMRLLKSCKAPDELQQAEQLWKRAAEPPPAPALVEDTLDADVAAWGQQSKQMLDALNKGSATGSAVQFRADVRKIEAAISSLRQRHEKFSQSFPPELRDMMQRNSGRLQQLQTTVDALTGTAGIVDPLGLKQMETAYHDVLRNNALIARRRDAIAGVQGIGNFHALVGDLNDRLTSCQAERRRTQQAPPPALPARVQQQYQALLRACGVKLNPPPPPLVVECNSTTKAGSNPPQTITVKVGRVAGVAHFHYEMFKVPDQMTVHYGGQMVADTGCIGGANTVALNLSGASDVVTIAVNPACRQSDTTQWNFTLSCPGSPAPARPAAAAFGSNFVPIIDKVLGDVRYYLTHPAEARPLRQADDLLKGGTVQTGAGAQLALRTVAGTKLTVAEHSVISLSAPGTAGTAVKLLSGTIDVDHPPGSSKRDDIQASSPLVKIEVRGTRYRVRHDARGTTVDVFEGMLHLSGQRIFRSDHNDQGRGKTAPVTELDLYAGQQAFMPSPATWADTPPRQAVERPLAPAAAAPARPADDVTIARPNAMPTRIEPWNDSQVQRLIDEWLRNAVPAVPPNLPGPWRFSEWGQALGPGSRAGGAPDHPVGWTRYQSLWDKRSQFDSANLCTLGEYIERRQAGRSLDGCAKRLPPPQPQPQPQHQPQLQVPPGQGQPQLPPPVQPPRAAPAVEAPLPPARTARPALHPARPLIDRLDAIPDGNWINGKPKLQGGSWQQLLVLAAEVYDPRLPHCARYAQRKGIEMAGLTSRDDLDYARWRGVPPFPIAVGAPARDALYTIEQASGRRPILTPIPLAFAYLLDRDGRVVDSGPCERVMSRVMGSDIGSVEGKH